MKNSESGVDWPRKNALNGCFDIVRTLKSLEECKEVTPASELLQQLTRSINLHRRCLVRLEKHAYEMVSHRFNGYRPEPVAPQPIDLPTDLEDPPPSNEPPVASLPLPVEVPPIPPTPLPRTAPLAIGERFRAAVQLAASPLEFYVVRCDDLRPRNEMEKALMSAPKQPSATGLSVGDVCAVIHKKKLLRAEVREAGKDDLLVFLIDHGSCHFVSRCHAFHLTNEFRKSPPLARFCSLADADSRKMDTAAVTNFARAISQNSDVIILACGKLRKSHGELVYIVEEGAGDHPTGPATNAANPFKYKGKRGKI